jgi:Uri superfamily endonuclease
MSKATDREEMIHLLEDRIRELGFGCDECDAKIRHFNVTKERLMDDIDRVQDQLEALIAEREAEKL